MPTYKVTLKTPSGTFTISVADGQYIQQAAEEKGVDLKHSCREGCCASCIAKVISGCVCTPEHSLLSETLVDQDFVLLCVTSPESDCTIETNKEEDL